MKQLVFIMFLYSGVMFFIELSNHHYGMATIELIFNAFWLFNYRMYKKIKPNAKP